MQRRQSSSMVALLLLLLLSLLPALSSASLLNTLLDLVSFDGIVNLRANCAVSLLLMFNREQGEDNLSRLQALLRPESIANLAQTGSYVGADAIAEYISFGVADTSPVFTLGPANAVSEIRVLGYKDGQCHGLIAFNAEYRTDPTVTAYEFNANFAVMMRLSAETGGWFGLPGLFRRGYVTNVNLFYKERQTHGAPLWGLAVVSQHAQLSL